MLQVTREKDQKGKKIQTLIRDLLKEIPSFTKKLGFQLHYSHGKKTFNLLE